MARQIENITEQSYQNFKNRYKRYLEENPSTATFIDPKNPINDPEFAGEVELFKFDPDNPQSTAQGPTTVLERLVQPDSPTQIAKSKNFQSSEDYFNFLKSNIVGRGKTGTDEFSREMSPEEKKKKQGVDEGNKALADFRRGAKTVYGLANPIGDGDERYRGFETVMLQDDGTYKSVNMENRSALDRFFGIGPEPLYREQTFNQNTGNFESNPEGRIVSEDELVNRQITQTAPSNVGNEIFTATETYNPDVDTMIMGADGNVKISNSQDVKASNVPTAGALNVDAQGNTSPNSQIFALAKFLDDASKRNQGFLGVNPSQFGGFFDDRQNLDRFYGRRNVGLFDDEFYNTAFNMFKQR